MVVIANERRNIVRRREATTDPSANPNRFSLDAEAADSEEVILFSNVGTIERLFNEVPAGPTDPEPAIPQDSQPSTPADEQPGPAATQLRVHRENRPPVVNPDNIRGVRVTGAEGDVNLRRRTLGSRIRSVLSSALEPKRRVAVVDSLGVKSKSILPRCLRIAREQLVDAITPPQTQTIIDVVQAVVDGDLVGDTVVVQPSAPGRLSKVGYKFDAHSLELAEEAKLRFGYPENTPETRRFIERSIRDMANAKRREGSWASMRTTDLLSISSRATLLFWVPRSEDVANAELMRTMEYQRVSNDPRLERQLGLQSH